MKTLIEVFNFLYVYCTDFVINLANLTNLSYYEINFIFFCLIYPLLFTAMPFIYQIQRYRLSKLKKNE